MRKLLTCILTVALLLSFLSACELLPEGLKDSLGSEGLNHEHTYEYAGNDYTHQRIYTCGCPTPDIAEMHYDNDGDELCDACKAEHKHVYGEWQYDEAYHWCSFKCLWEVCDIDTTAEHTDTDNDRLCDVCGYQLSEFPTPTNHFLRNLSGCEWLNEIDAKDITSIKITREIAGIAPGNLKTISVSFNSDVIAELFEEYYLLDTSPIPTEDAMITGGSSITVKFTLSDGSEKQIYFYDGIYCDTNSNYFKALQIPYFTKEMNPHAYNGFITYVDKGIVYKKNATGSSIISTGAIGEIDISSLEFHYDLDIDFTPGFDPDEYGVTVWTEFGKLTFITPAIFIYDGLYCMLVGKSIEELINEDGVNALIDAREAKYNDGRVASVEQYYGEYSSGAVVGMVVDDHSAYTEACWSEMVDGYRFDYYYGNRIIVLYEGEFYTLGEAFNKGCLTTSDIAIIWSIHNY